MTETAPCAWASSIVDWLLAPDSRHLDVGALTERLVERLEEAGLSIDRLVMSVPTKHPEVFVLNLEYLRGKPIRVVRRGHEIRTRGVYLDSPVRAIHEGADLIRCRLEGPEVDTRFPVCADLAREGLTDYAAFALAFAHHARSFVSFATRRPGGFRDEDLSGLGSLRDALALRVELSASVFATECLLEVYLGKNAARRVLAGAFMRGSGEVIPAAIFFCDMRGFTAMADARTPDEVVRTLDALFDVIAAPLQARGGEILKFIGDAVLAVFAEDGGGPRACRAAFEASREALAAIARWNGERSAVGEAAVEIGVALHRGDVFYGNIGAQDRLDFTVIGRAVNEASRVESMCKTLGEPLLLTHAFREALGEAPLRAVGRHALRGVSGGVELFTAASSDER